MAQFVNSARAPFKLERKTEELCFSPDNLRQSFPEPAEWEDDLNLEMLMLDG
jgi:hypothetical protein